MTELPDETRVREEVDRRRILMAKHKEAAEKLLAEARLHHERIRDLDGEIYLILQGRMRI